MKNLLFTIYFLSVFFCSNAETINLKSFGGKTDGKTSNTAIIKKAIDKLTADGGGTLYFPAGTYLTGPIKLENNITIDIESGATILFSGEYEEYTPFVEIRYEGVVMKSFCPLFYAYEKENITIKGRGKIDGNGSHWWHVAWAMDGIEKYAPLLKRVAPLQELWDKENPNLKIEEQSDWKRTFDKKFFRPPFIQMYKSKNILIEGITIVNSPFWTINPEFCENVTVKGVSIFNPYSPNTDGINPSSCKDVHISDCHISVGDDCITLKSGRDLQGREYATPCENVTITNCTMLAGHGGVVIGSEMSGDVHKITISNCIFDGTDRGIRIKSTRGRGGIVEEIRVSNVVMKNIKKEAITLNLFYSNVPAEPISERTPIFRNIHFSNITGSDVNAACTIWGIEEAPISNITFTNVNMDAQTGFDINKSKDLTFTDVQVNATLSPSFTIKNSENIYMNNVYTLQPNSEKSLISLTDVKDVFINRCFPLAGSKSFLKAEGASTNNIILTGNYLKRLNQTIEKSQDLNPNAIIIE
ncbi:glycoside hydrolase family 28 protein [Dysgonomonas sp. HDW5B]|uniref:glycoside hydrolase family 28 protein n=1 Tax=Dysgonomonas sp. HDW5B TaxID=2714927 RepID=UPI00140882FC|nr:glycoside hydrolase family 28 protein [Dysgonomonas sp. HDW5B]QIK55691.1 glycoside hydrolase family 28 protein [Dysgonomonas sp. HDW5B]